MCLCYLVSAKTAWQLMNRKTDFFYKTNRFESIRKTNRIDSNRELECSTPHVYTEIARICGAAIRPGNVVLALRATNFTININYIVLWPFCTQASRVAPVQADATDDYNNIHCVLGACHAWNNQKKRSHMDLAISAADPTSFAGTMPDLCPYYFPWFSIYTYWCYRPSSATTLLY